MNRVDTLTTIQGIIKEKATEIIGDVPQIVLQSPKDMSHGDISTPIALSCAKKSADAKVNDASSNNTNANQDAMHIAEDIAAVIRSKELPYIKEVSVLKPGFINIHFSDIFFKEILRDIEHKGDDFGKTDLLKGQRWVIEHTSPNPNKAMHIGHLRNNILGMTLVRLCEFNGASVIADTVDNNRGIAIAKVMWGFLSGMKKDPEKTPTDIHHWVDHKDEWHSPEDTLPDIFVSQCYELGEEASENPADEEHIRDMVVKWEEGDVSVLELWEHVLAYSYEGQKRTLTRLGNRWDIIWHEHEHYKKGKEYIEEGLKKHVFVKTEDGAVLTDLEEYNLPNTIVLKKDGTALYITQDIALTALKKETHPSANKMVWVVGSDQTLAMKQLFAVCEQLGIGSRDDFIHIPYGYVGLKDDGVFKKMSSRKGNIVLIDTVLDTVKQAVMEKCLEQTDMDTDYLSESLAKSAVFFNMVKSDKNQDIAFDVNQSIDTRGDSGVYVIYSIVRAHSILRKAEEKGIILEDNSDVSDSIDISDNTVVRLLAKFEEVITHTQNDLSPHHIAQYLLRLCSEFNTWYAQEKILDDTNSQHARISIVKGFAQAAKNGAALLGMEPLERM